MSATGTMERLASGLMLAGPLAEALGASAIERLTGRQDPKWLDPRIVNPELHQLADALEYAASLEASTQSSSVL